MQKSRPLILVILLVILNTGCQTLEPHNDILNTPLSDVELEQVLFDEGDLPMSYQAGEILHAWPQDILIETSCVNHLTEFIAPESIASRRVGSYFSQEFDSNYVCVALLEDKEQIRLIYDCIVNNYSLEKISPSEVGDQSAFSVLSTTSGGCCHLGTNDSMLLFHIDHAIAIIRIEGEMLVYETLREYAHNIEERLDKALGKKNGAIN
jgi:hypothetical protein